MPLQVVRYRDRLSGPLMDRIDLHIEMPAVKYEQLKNKNQGESSAAIRSRVEKARSRQRARYEETAALTNAQLQSRHFDDFCPLTGEAGKLLQQAFQGLGLSMRAHDRIIRVARTISDLDHSEILDSTHIAKAIQYRSLDRGL